MRWREYRDVVAKLKRCDQRFEVHIRRGRGSHRMLVHPDVEGVTRHYPIPYHGMKTPVAPGMQKDIIRVFQLPEGVFD